MSDGPIRTEGAREIHSQVAVGQGQGRNKSLNEVQGRVSLNSIGTGGGSGTDALFSSQGLSVAGDGSVSQSEIEKALLADSTLAGHVMMQWTIGASGSASNVSVLRSQLNNAQLHNCLAAEIEKVRFPSPQGGTVIVKYPFAFSSTPF